MTDLQKAVWATLAYYDVFSFPLTVKEAADLLVNPSRFKKYSKEKSGFVEVREALIELAASGQIEEGIGFYFLSGRKSLCLPRLEKNKIAEEKWRKARRYLSWMRSWPYIEGVLVSGSLALGHTGPESDLDIMIITKPGRIWLVRLWVWLWFGFWGVRRKKEDQFAPDKICPNHFITTASLNIPFPSLYNAQTYAHLVPVYARRPAVLENFTQANQWIKQFLPAWSGLAWQPARKIKENKWLRAAAFLSEGILEITRLGRGLNRLAKKLQAPRINSGLPGRVVANDQQLEFHPYSVEKKVLADYHSRLAEKGEFGSYQEPDSGLN